MVPSGINEGKGGSELIKERNEKGFTLVELLIVMVIAAIVMTSVYSLYSAQQRSYVVQEEVAAMHQNLRAAMSFMEREIRMAGCDPTGTSGAGIVTADPSLIRFTEDVRGKDPGDPPDGVIKLDQEEDISFFLVDADGDGQVDDLVRDTGGVEEDIEKVIAENIDSLNFAYLDSGGITTTVLENIRFVRITLVAGNNDGSKTDALQTRIHARNLGI